MLIAINNCFGGRCTGDHNFARQLLKRLVSNCRQHQFLLFTDADQTGFEPAANNLKIVPIKPPIGKLLVGRIIWQRVLQKNLSSPQPGALINLNPFVAFSSPKNQLLVADEIAVAYFKGGAGRTERRQFLQNLELANQIAIPSSHQQTVLQSAVNHLQTTNLVYAGVDLPSAKLDWPEKEAIKEKYAGGKEYFLLQKSRLGSSLLINVLKAFSLFKKRQQSQLQLLIPQIAIDKLPQFEEKLKTYKHREDVQIVPSLPVEEQVRLTAAAYAVIDPAPHIHSRAFVLQAFESETPLIVSHNSPALAWTGDDAALTANMEAPEELAAKMMLLYKDEHLRSRIIAAGNARLEIFNWENAADHLQRCLEAVIQKS